VSKAAHHRVETILSGFQTAPSSSRMQRYWNAGGRIDYLPCGGARVLSTICLMNFHRIRPPPPRPYENRWRGECLSMGIVLKNQTWAEFLGRGREEMVFIWKGERRIGHGVCAGRFGVWHGRGASARLEKQRRSEQNPCRRRIDRTNNDRIVRVALMPGWKN